MNYINLIIKILNVFDYYKQKKILKFLKTKLLGLNNSC